MKKLILALLVLVTTGATAQKSLFDNISATNQYDYYSQISVDKNGAYLINDRGTATFDIKKLATGEGYYIEAFAIKDGKQDFRIKRASVIENYDRCKGYPYESYTRHKYEKDGFVAIGDYVFYITDITEDGTSFKNIRYVFIKSSEASKTASGETKPEKKNKFSFKDLANAVKDNYTGSTSVQDFGPAHKELSSKNVKQFIIDYLVAMKAKQDGRSTAQKQGDARIEKARTDYDNGITAFNDSTKATPEYQDLQRRIAQNEANYQAAQKADVVTLKNNSGSVIFVGKQDSDLTTNKGTEISAGGTASWDCHYDAYIQRHSMKGGTNIYTTTSTKVYSKNTGCGNTVNVN